jgi:hypothetical protein
VPLADLHMIAMPSNRAIDDLAVNTGICAKLIAAGPFLQIEQVAEELEGLGLPHQLETERATEMAF